MEDAFASRLFSSNSLTTLVRSTITCPEQILWTEILSMGRTIPAPSSGFVMTRNRESRGRSPDLAHMLHFTVQYFDFASTQQPRAVAPRIPVPHRTAHTIVNIFSLERFFLLKRVKQRLQLQRSAT